MTRTLIQGDESPAPTDDLSAYRVEFHNMAHRRFDPAHDRVIIVEPNTARHPALRELWADWRRVDVLEGTALAGVTVMFTSTHTPSPLLSPDPGYVRAHHPDAEPVARAVVPIDLATLDADAGGAAVISLDARHTTAMVDQHWDRIAAREVIIELPRTAARSPVRGTPLRALGWHPAGRAWGPAGTNARWRRGGSPAERLSDVLLAGRVRAGITVVRVRELLPIGARGRALRLRLATRMAGRGRDVLDPAFGLAHEPLSAESVRLDVQMWNRRAGPPNAAFWDVQADLFDDPIPLARECHRRLAVWPISFSYPGELLPLSPQRRSLIGPTVPGFPYAFEDPGSYLRTYSASALGVTHRKAGWDCFRHVEILAAGALPLMIDADQLPPFCMVHHPHRALREILRRVRSGDGWPEASVFERMRTHTERYLTSAAMADYLLRMAGLREARRILFVDRQHPATSDYQSTLALIGLKQILGRRVESMFPAPWIHAGDPSPTRHLYGRGFGYTHSVDPQSRTDQEAATPQGEQLRDLDLDDYDVVVIGSCSRNRELAESMRRHFAPERTIWIHGEDTPPLPEDVRWIRGAGVHAYVRAIEVRG